MVFTKEQVNEIRSKAVTATEQLRLEFAPIEGQRKKREEKIEKDAVALSKKREENPPSKEELAGEALSKVPICDDGKTSIIELIKALTGMVVVIPAPVEEKEEEEITKKHIVLSMVVPTINKNSHDYPLNIPVMMINGIKEEGCDLNNGICITGTRGNHLEWIKSGLRPATVVEIDGFFKAWEALSEAGCPLCEDYDLLGIEKKDEDGD